ncbi:MAG: endonuclease III domain-containing protein [Syntrophomonadaceae bacterium]|nr:endonuclease III domain-containing protein [Syntrophomonadaceae bacterium]
MRGLLDIYNTLLKAYGQRHWWPADTAYEMMVGAILTQNTTWLNVEKAINNLGKRLSPEYIAAASNEDLAVIIRPSGYYNQKVLKLKALTEWFKKYSYDVEQARQIDGQLLRDELLAVKGVGPETADSILLYALDKPFFVVDAYTRRFLARLGYALPQAYDELRVVIENSLPQAVPLYNEFHALIVEHAKQHCKKTPLCPACPVEDVCAKCFEV